MPRASRTCSLQSDQGCDLMRKALPLHGAQCESVCMELEELLSAMDRTAANLKKLDSVWERAKPFIPTGPQLGSDVQYDSLRAAWADLLPGLPQIDGWTITD